MVLIVKDEYDRAVAWLTANPKYIETAWDEANCPMCAVRDIGDNLSPDEHEEIHKKAACLFQNCGELSGCLTQVAHWEKHDAGSSKLAIAIRADRANIPRNGAAIQVEDLPTFAKWRRRIDKEGVLSDTR